MPANPLAPAIARLLLIGSIAIGLGFLVFAAFGLRPGLGDHAFSLGPWRSLFADPRLAPSILNAVMPGLIGTLISVFLAFALLAWLDPGGLHKGRMAALLCRAANAILAMPHAAFALGLAFLLAPGGWLLRLWASLGLADRLPIDFALTHDGAGGGLILALILKETPFLLVIGRIALSQMPVSAYLALGAAFGYRPHLAWLKLVLPGLYARLRLPILAVLAYNLSVIDMSLILGPTLPPGLPPLILIWMRDADLGWQNVAAAGALLHGLLVLAALLLWQGGERAARPLALSFLRAGRRTWPPILSGIGQGLGFLAFILLLTLPALSALALILWSFAGAWHFPALLPLEFSSEAWSRAFRDIGRPLAISLVAGFLAAAIALFLAILCLNAERKIQPSCLGRAEALLYLPLLVPDIAFLFGIQILLAALGLIGAWVGLIWCHLLFVFPYVFLALRDGWRALDPRYEKIAAALGASRSRQLLKIRLPLLKPQIALAAAIGFAVSLSLYLPSVIAGAGRLPSLATEAVALASGGDRRIVGVYGALQMGLVLAALTIAHLWAGNRGRRG